MKFASARAIVFLAHTRRLARDWSRSALAHERPLSDLYPKIVMEDADVADMDDDEEQEQPATPGFLIDEQAKPELLWFQCSNFLFLVVFGC